MLGKSNGITRGYYVITRADGTVEPAKKVFHVSHRNTLKRWYYILRERIRN